MNREDIIRMAREAGAIPIHKNYSQKALVGNENIERFFQAAYAAGAAAERKEMVTLAAKQGWAMKNEDPFEDAVCEIAAIRARSKG